MTCKVSSQKWTHVRKRALKIEPGIINRVKSDDFWTGEISKNTLTDEIIWLIKLMDTEAGVCSMKQVLTNMHFCLT